jgi:hypothetical protein
MSERTHRPELSGEAYDRLVETAAGPAGLDCETYVARAHSTEELLEAVLDAHDEWQELTLKWKKAATDD